MGAQPEIMRTPTNLIIVTILMISRCHVLIPLPHGHSWNGRLHSRRYDLQQLPSRERHNASIPEKILCICFCYKALAAMSWTVHVPKMKLRKGGIGIHFGQFCTWKKITNLKISKLKMNPILHRLPVWSDADDVKHCQNSGRTWYWLQIWNCSHGLPLAWLKWWQGKNRSN